MEASTYASSHFLLQQVQLEGLCTSFFLLGRSAGITDSGVMALCTHTAPWYHLSCLYLTFILSHEITNQDVLHNHHRHLHTNTHNTHTHRAQSWPKYPNSFLFFKYRVSLYSPNHSGTCPVDQACLCLQSVGLEACATTARQLLIM